MRKTIRTIGILLGLLMVAGFLTACSNTKTYASDCGLVVGRGIGDARTVKRIIHPGEVSHLKGDDEQFVVPCNARNILIQPEGGDSNTPAQGVSQKPLGEHGEILGPGTPVKAYLRMYWTLNQDDKVLGGEFFPFCRKYACASRNTDGSEDNANFATPGWNGMIKENHLPVIDTAFRQAMQQFKPDVWNDQSQWPEVAVKMAPLFMEAMRQATGSNDDFFCGTWTPADKSDPGKGTGKCTNVRFVIADIKAPIDVEQAYNANIKAQQESVNRINEIKRQENQVAAEQDLADKRQKLYTIPGYQQQLDHQYRMEEIAACGAAHLAVCPGSNSGVVVSPKP